MQNNEKELVKKLRKSSTAALGEIIDRYTAYVRTVIFNLSRGTIPEQDVDDICADVFYSLWKRRENLDIKIGFRSYLSAIARNAVKDRFKSEKMLCENIDDISELEAAGDLSVEAQAELNEMLRCIDKRLLELGEKERMIFVRFYFYGKTTAEIAREMEISESNVRSSLSRIRNKLKEYLMERGFDHA